MLWHASGENQSDGGESTDDRNNHQGYEWFGVASGNRQNAPERQPHQYQAPQEGSKHSSADGGHLVVPLPVNLDLATMPVTTSLRITTA